MKRVQRGFTLLEVMVALMLMGLLSVMAYRGLDAILVAEAHARAEMDRWDGVNRVFKRIENDLGNSVELGAADFFLGANGTSLAWTRLLPEDEPGGLRRVGYTFADGVLKRQVWRTAAPAEETPRTAELLAGAASVNFRCLDGQGAWHAQWPVASVNAGLPSAVELNLVLASGENLRRVVMVR